LLKRITKGTREMNGLIEIIVFALGIAIGVFFGLHFRKAQEK